jgi:hypothetical protein
MMAHPNSSSHRLTGSGSCSMLFIAEMHCIDKQFERDVHDSSSVYKPTGVCKDRARSTLVCAKIEQEAHWCAGHTDRTAKSNRGGQGQREWACQGKGQAPHQQQVRERLWRERARASCLPYLSKRASELRAPSTVLNLKNSERLPSTASRNAAVDQQRPSYVLTPPGGGVCGLWCGGTNARSRTR